MAIKKSQVALHVRVKLNSLFEPKCLGDGFLMKDEIVYISDEHVHNDSIGEYVHIKGYTITKENNSIYMNSGYAYLNQLDLEFPIQY